MKVPSFKSLSLKGCIVLYNIFLILILLPILLSHIRDFFLSCDTSRELESALGTAFIFLVVSGSIYLSNYLFKKIGNKNA